MKSSRLYVHGLKDGIPIALGYLSVSFGFGVSAINSGLSPLEAVLMSLTNLTSAGQMAGLASITSDGTVALLTLATALEIALTQLVINIRYFLMNLSLTQKLDQSFTTPHRLCASFGITDEIFGVASAHKGNLSPAYLYGLIFLPLVGWTLGTLLGSVAGTILPDALKHALGITIYGMFVAIVVPPAKTDRGVLLSSLLAIAASCAIAYLPWLQWITSGFAIIIAALIGAVAAALVRPIDADPTQEDQATQGGGNL